MARVAVIGAGVVGLSVAMKLKEEFGERVLVTVISDCFMFQTTSHGCGGLWMPYQLTGTPEEAIKTWGAYTFEYFRHLHASGDATRAGVQLITAHLLTTDLGGAAPFWSTVVQNFQELSREELDALGIPFRGVRAHRFSTFVADQKYYMKFLTDELKSRGVSFIQTRLSSLEDPSLEGYQLLVNCAGLGAHDLVGNETVVPVRGQVMRLRAPWVKAAWIFGESYIIPNIDTVVVGGTALRGSWDTRVSIDDSQSILTGAGRLFPALLTAPIESEWVGLRPVRAPLRLESEWRASFDHQQVRVVHCYGHGGAGVTLSIGTAHEVAVAHVRPWLEDAEQQQHALRSRL